MTHTAAAADYAALRAIGWPHEGPARDDDWAVVTAKVLGSHPHARPVRISEQHRSGYVVADGVAGDFAVESPPEWQRPPAYRRGSSASEQRAAVGDWVLIDGMRIIALLPRRSAIKRAAAGEHYRQQVIAANVDTAFVVCGLDNDFNLRRIERYLLLVQGGGVTPVVVLTKADVDGHDVAAARAALATLEGQRIDVLAVNARDVAAAAALQPWLGSGRTAVLVGSSGAGKSTLTNSLLGRERMRTAAVRESDARGRHTTTHRALIPLPAGGCLIDTPGMRELKPTGEEDLADGGFDDITALAAQCRFRDCQHAREPGCAVRAAIASGHLDDSRLRHYQKLHGELAAAAGRLAARVAERNSGKTSGGRPGVRPPDVGDDTHDHAGEEHAGNTHGDNEI